MSKTDLIKIDNFFVKREDQNPTGSTKDRALTYQIQNLLKYGFKQAVISSTGNAAISASHFCQQHNLPLTIFLSPKINQNKLKLIKKYQNQIIFDPKPISSAFKYAKSNQAYFLRQSTDPSALVGYGQIGHEIIQQLPKITSIFVPVGSGTTLLGISQALPKTTRLFAVQPANNPTIASYFDKHFTSQKDSLTDSLTAKYLPLKKRLLSAIQQSQGGGVVISNQQIKDQLDYLKTNHISTSPESAMALAGLKKAIQNNYQIGDHPVIIFTGAKR